MEYESKRTARQEWGETSERKQEQVNATLEQLQPDIDVINLTLEQLSCENSEKAAEYAAEAAQHLDSRWEEHMGDVFLVTGTWMGPSATYSPGEQRLLFEYGRQQAFDSVQCFGFDAYQDVREDGESITQIGMTFLAREREISIPLFHGRLAFRHVADPREVTLQYMRPGMEGTVSSDLGEINEAIHRADLLLDLYLNNEKSGFYRTNAKRQHKIVNSILDSINDVMPSPETNEALLIDIVASRIYLQHYNEERIAAAAVENDDFQLSGRVHGVTTYDTVKYDGKKQFRDANDCETAQDGLALIIEVHNSNVDLSECDRTVLVPLRHARQMNMIFE